MLPTGACTALPPPIAAAGSGATYVGSDSDDENGTELAVVSMVDEADEAEEEEERDSAEGAKTSK